MISTTRRQAEKIGLSSRDAYSYDAYGCTAWLECCRACARHGFSPYAIDTIMRSKWTRWAGDAAERNTWGNLTSRDLMRFLSGGSDAIRPENWTVHMGIDPETDDDSIAILDAIGESSPSHAAEPELLGTLRVIQAECENSPNGLHEATLGVIAMKVRCALAKVKQ
jgi:hypothetical protein